MPTACLRQSWQDGQTSPPSAPPCSAGPPSAISTTSPDLPFRRGGVVGVLPTLTTLPKLATFTKLPKFPKAPKGFKSDRGNREKGKKGK